MNWRNVTKFSIIGVAVLLGGYDIFVVLKSGVNATISRVVYNAAADYPITAFAFGVLIGHLYWAQKIER